MCPSVEKDYFDDSKSVLAEIKGEDIDITSDRDNDEDELAVAFAKEKKKVDGKKESLGLMFLCVKNVWTGFKIGLQILEIKSVEMRKLTLHLITSRK